MVYMNINIMVLSNRGALPEDEVPPLALKRSIEIFRGRDYSVCPMDSQCLLQS